MKKLFVAAAAACVLVLAACGGTHHSAGAPVIKPPVNTPRAAIVEAKVVSQHVCDPKDYLMACALPSASVSQIARGVDPVAQGVDFGWSCPVSVAQSFGASYLSYDASKDWTLSCVNAFHAQHKGTVAVWEAGANDAQGSYSLGFSQARRAAQELSALGAPKGQPFDMAIDCDCAGSTLVSYFKGANAAEPGRVNAYGGYYQLAYLSSQHLVGHLNWQTYAWSGGRWLSGSVAPLEQYLNSSSVDYDRAIASNFGQWPYMAPKPPVPWCSRSMCLGRFPNIAFKANAGVCSHGCNERQYVVWWQGAQRQSHAHRLYLRYRLQWLERRLGWLVAHSPPADNAINRRGDREHILWAAGYRAAYRTNYNAYLKVSG